MPQGSNDLNMLLKAKVIQIRVELDLSRTEIAKLKGQVDTITEKLKDKPVKLKVELRATIKELKEQVGKIKLLMANEKNFKPIKIGIELDVKGSATHIKNQLKEIKDTVDDFNKSYGNQIKKMQEHTNKVTKGSGTGIGSQDNESTKQYVESLKEAEALLRSTHGKKGFFSANEFKDAEGNLKGFIASLEKANGVVQKVRYDWDSEKESFSPISQQTLTNSEKAMKGALLSLRELDREILKLGKDGEKFQKESLELEKRFSHNTLTQEAVNALKTRINDEKALLSVQKQENNELREQKKLISDVVRASNKARGGNKSKLLNLKDKLISSDLSGDDLANIKHEYNEIKKNITEQIAKEKDLTNAVDKRLHLLNEIKLLERTTTRSGAGANSDAYFAETKRLAKNIETMDDYSKAKKRMDATNREQVQLSVSEKTVTQLDKLRKAMVNYALATGRSLQTIETRYDQVAHNVKDNLEMATNETKRWTKLLENFNAQQKLDQRRNSIVDIPEQDHQKVSGLIKSNDIDGLKDYIGLLNDAKVATLRLSTDDKGLSKITATMDGAGKTTKQFGYEIDDVNKKLRLTSQADVFNRNANLGVFEQLRIAMARVPVWMVAMTAFYGTIGSVRAMTTEILKVDSALTELKRVADSHINISTIFEGALDISANLGNNIHDVMQSINDLARTYGDFNERQLLAIANTATLMANVSDLNAQEATESLVGTMNAFNKTAEESIVIVDSLNEVDNNYAVSTKQLATGLAKSASTAKTFGKQMPTYMVTCIA